MRQNITESLERYVKYGVPTGGFLQAVLENDLCGAFSRADEENRRDLFGIVSCVYNELPSECWGSPERVRTWLANMSKDHVAPTGAEVTPQA